jgi:hypothetical protein
VPQVKRRRSGQIRRPDSKRHGPKMRPHTRANYTRLRHNRRVSSMPAKKAASHLIRRQFGKAWPESISQAEVTLIPDGYQTVNLSAIGERQK